MQRPSFASRTFPSAIRFHSFSSHPLAAITRGIISPAIPLVLPLPGACHERTIWVAAGEPDWWGERAQPNNAEPCSVRLLLSRFVTGELLGLGRSDNVAGEAGTLRAPAQHDWLLTEQGGLGHQLSPAAQHVAEHVDRLPLGLGLPR